jgi:hypothetical protein
MPVAEPTIRMVPVNPSEMPTAPPSEEAQREPRRLRVGHTMVGLTNPLAEVPGAEGHVARGTSSNPPTPRSYDPMEEPVELPTTGLPPSLVGFMVLGAMVLVAVAGFLLLR